MVPSPPEIEEARVRSFVDGQMDRVRKSLALIGDDLGYQVAFLNAELDALVADGFRALFGIPCREFPREFHDAYSEALKDEIESRRFRIAENLRLARAI
jgi:hypothetical protein